MDERFPTRRHSPNRIGHEVLTSHIETCWSRGFRVNETLRRKFTCVAAYFFVRQDSRTSVALCTACPPNRMSISLRFSSFQLIVHAEFCLAYPCQQALHPPGLRSLGRGGAPRDGGCDGARQQRLRPHGAETRETRGGLTRAEKRCYNLREICGD